MKYIHQEDESPGMALLEACMKDEWEMVEAYVISGSVVEARDKVQNFFP